MSACWIICEAKAGMLVQARALARALGVEAEERLAERRLPWSRLPLVLWPHSPARLGAPACRPPWPKLALSCGRYGGGVARAVKALSAGATRAVQIQDPGSARGDFDVLVLPEHDGVTGPNVLLTTGSLNAIDDALLAAEAARHASRYARLPRPLVGVLIGGASAHYRLGPEEAERLGCDLAALSRDHGAGLALTVSRRTPPAAAERLRRHLDDLPADLWDGAGENPYFGILGLADALVVTCDSVNMLSEAAASGKPTHVYRLPGGSKRLARFHAALEARGCTRPYDGTLGHWRYSPLREAARIAGELHARAPWLD